MATHGITRQPKAKLIITNDGLAALRDLVDMSDARVDDGDADLLPSMVADRERSGCGGMEKSAGEKQHEFNKESNCRLVYTMYNEKREPYVDVSLVIKRGRPLGLFSCETGRNCAVWRST